MGKGTIRCRPGRVGTQKLDNQNVMYLFHCLISLIGKCITIICTFYLLKNFWTLEVPMTG